MGDIVILFGGEELKRVTHQDLAAGRLEKLPYLGRTVDVTLDLRVERIGQIPLHVGHDRDGVAYVYGRHGNISFIEAECIRDSIDGHGEILYAHGDERRLSNGMHIQIVHTIEGEGETPWIFNETVQREYTGLVEVWWRRFRHLER